MSALRLTADIRTGSLAHYDAGGAGTIHSIYIADIGQPDFVTGPGGTEGTPPAAG